LSSAKQSADRSAIALAQNQITPSIAALGFNMMVEETTAAI